MMSELAPAYEVDTEILGGSMAGNSRIPRELNPIIPNRIRNRLITVASIGLLSDNSDIFTVKKYLHLTERPKLNFVQFHYLFNFYWSIGADKQHSAHNNRIANIHTLYEFNLILISYSGFNIGKYGLIFMNYYHLI